MDEDRPILPRRRADAADAARSAHRAAGARVRLSAGTEAIVAICGGVTMQACRVPAAPGLAEGRMEALHEPRAKRRFDGRITAALPVRSRSNGDRRTMPPPPHGVAGIAPDCWRSSPKSKRMPMGIDGHSTRSAEEPSAVHADLVAVRAWRSRDELPGRRRRTPKTDQKSDSRSMPSSARPAWPALCGPLRNRGVQHQSGTSPTLAHGDDAGARLPAPLLERRSGEAEQLRCRDRRRRPRELPAWWDDAC